VGRVGAQNLAEARDGTFKVARGDAVEGALVQAGDTETVGTGRVLGVDRYGRHGDEKSRYE
jgi:hypothetical protein